MAISLRPLLGEVPSVPLFCGLDDVRSLERLLACIEKTFPVPARFVPRIPEDIAELSRLLTSERPLREDGYLGEPRFFSAYCRYFLPWNVYRLCKLFSHIASGPARAIALALTKDQPVITDFGAGPLTLALALWCSFPEARLRPLTIQPVDGNRNALREGSRLFAAFAPESPWKIECRRGKLGDALELPRADLVTSVYMLNEVFSKIRQADLGALANSARKTARHFARESGGLILIAEPGIPRSAQYLGLLKDAFAELGFYALHPCPPETDCPARGGRRGAKWCHFVFDTDDAPAALQKISTQAGLAKKRATLAFMLFGRERPQREEGTRSIRVISESFALDGGHCGRYCCSADGLLLLRGGRETLAALEPGTCLDLKAGSLTEKDGKSGCAVVRVNEQ